MRYAELSPEERGIGAFGRLAAETGAMEVLREEQQPWLDRCGLVDSDANSPSN